MTSKEKENLLHVAESAALLAGEYLKNRKEDWLNIKSASGHDVKIKADRKSEELILKCLGISNIPFLCEESGAVTTQKRNKCKGDNSNLIWIIDPLDGTLNYYQGIPLSCVSIALYNGKKPILGVIFDFNHGELFSGIVGCGAWLNHKPIQSSPVNEISKAVLCTGFPVNTDFSSPALSRFIDEIQHFRKVRLLGSAALSLCYVACGRADAYKEDNIMLWDVAAGLALVQSAGGAVKLKNFNHISSPVNVTATNALLKIDGMGNSKKKWRS